MSADGPLKVVLCWHMHQPQYRNEATGHYQLPWTYLHGIKDYVDMAAIIAAVPGARAVVNFAPILLEQIDDYAGQIQAFLDHGGAIRDPLLATLAATVMPAAPEARARLVEACLKVNRETVVSRFSPYRRLVDIADRVLTQPDLAEYVADQFLVDLVVWYHLAWLGETVRRRDGRVRALMDKGGRYTLHERRQLLVIVGELMADIIPTYRRLWEAGQVELSFTPYAHPIAPLLLDFASAREAMPDVCLPAHPAYPGGEARARWHLEEGLRVFERFFGRRPVGCWPAEGGVSEALLPLAQAAGVRWLASGERVLRNSLARQEAPPEGGYCIHRPYRRDGHDLHLFFRDDGLSDLIGFSYAKWSAEDAVADLVGHLENIAAHCPERDRAVVPIILDGENAWEYYPENGYPFLTHLYERLASHPQLELTTFADCLAMPAQPLAHLVAGSWVYGTFSTWIGDEDKNRGWDLLCEAKLAYDRAAPRLEDENARRAERQLAYCEGSDWFWWFGDYNPAQSVSDFERLYRTHLTNLYHMIGEEPPESLAQIISQGGGAPAAGGVMRPGSGQ